MSKSLANLIPNKDELALFCLEEEIDLLIAFGSRSTGEAHSKSDLDLAIKFRDASKEIDFLSFLLRLSRLFNMRLEIDPVVLKQSTPIILRHEIFANGKLLYEVREGLFIDEAFRAWLSFQEAKPLLERHHREFMKSFFRKWHVT